MALTTSKRRKPQIMISQSDHEKLILLGESWTKRNPDAADDLLAELDRARVVDDARLRPDVVRMGSTLRYVTDAGEDRTVTLVYPAEADISLGKISVMTPIGVVLIGLSPGQSIDWESRDGRVHNLTVESVEPWSGGDGLPQAS